MELGDRGAGLPDGGDDPAFLQLDACAEGPAELDLGGDRDLFLGIIWLSAPSATAASRWPGR
jgi:hypothetical protein